MRCQIPREVAVAPWTNGILETRMSRAGVEQQGIELANGLLLVTAHQLGQGVLDGQIVMQEDAIVGLSIGAYSLLITRLSTFKRGSHAWVKRVEQWFGGDRQKVDRKSV